MAKKVITRVEGDIREYPSYSVEDVARYLGVPRATLRAWISGYIYTVNGKSKRAKPIILPSDPEKKLLSFFNLVEAQVLAATRSKKISLQAVRRAVEYLREHEDEPRPLLTTVFQTAGRNLFVQQLSGKNLSNPLNVSRYGQYGIKKVLEKYLDRVVRDSDGRPIKLYPLKAQHGEAQKKIVIHPFVSAGKPSLPESGISAETIWNRKKSGESVSEIAKDFRLKKRDIEAAIDYWAA